MKQIHFVGIAGIGVSALAQVAQARGVSVSGSDPHADPQSNPAVARLLSGGATLFRTHRADNLADHVDLVVASAAIAGSNPELQAAQKRGIRVVSRAEFLGELMAAHKGPKIAVAGTHGKTTTTAMIGVLLQHAGLDPTVFVGGEVAQLGGNVRVGSETGPFVAEACEAYDSFLHLQPDIAVLTNIEADHLDHYGTFERVLESFRRFLRNVPSDTGDLIFCGEDAKVRTLARSPERHRLKTTAYFITEGIWRGFVYPASYATALVLGQTTSFDWYPYPMGGPLPVVLRVPGRHNVLNALAAGTVGVLLGLSKEALTAGLEAFQGATRRQEILGEVALDAAGSVLVMDDYAHHPTEIRATIDALRAAYPQRRLVAVFQPHLYSRTRDFLGAFAEALALADALLVTDIYAAREAPIEGVRAADIVNLAAQRNPNVPAIFLPDKRDVPKMLLALTQPGDLALFLGAGDIREQGEIFLQQMQRKTSA